MDTTPTPGRRIPALLGALALVVAMAIAVALPPPGDAATNATWTASVGAAGANGKATLTAPTTAASAGTLKLALKGLAASTTYPVRILKGTCAAPGAVLFTAPSQRSTAAGRIARSVAVPGAKMDAIRAATAVILRVGSGAKLRCGPFTGGMPAETATPEPSLQAKVGASAAPGSLAGVAVDDASVWVGRELSAKAYRLDPSTAATAATVEFSTAIGSPLITICGRPALGSGSLWVPALDFTGPVVGGYVMGKGVLLRIDTATAAVVAKVALGATTVGTAAAGEGSIWVVQSSPSTLVRVDPATNVVVRTVELPYMPHDVAVGSGAAWVTGGGKLLRVDLATYAITSLDLGSAMGVAVADGSVWVAVGRTDTASARLVRVAPSTLTEAASVLVPGSPDGVAAGGGYVWLAPSDEADPTAIAVGVASNAIVASVALPAALDGVAIRGRSAWFAGSKATGDQPDVVRVDY